MVPKKSNVIQGTSMEVSDTGLEKGALLGSQTLSIKSEEMIPNNVDLPDSLDSILFPPNSGETYSSFCWASAYAPLSVA